MKNYFIRNYFKANFILFIYSGGNPKTALTGQSLGKGVQLFY